jgi:hypothetical protein
MFWRDVWASPPVKARVARREKQTKFVGEGIAVFTPT